MPLCPSDFEVLWAELKQTMHLKVGCLDFGPVRDRGSLGGSKEVFITISTTISHKQTNSNEFSTSNY